MELIIHSLSKSYNRKGKADNDFALSIRKVTFSGNKLIAILGDSGAGKSTLLNIIGCLEKDYQGIYEINNSITNEKIVNGTPEKTRSLNKVRIKNFSFIYQKYNLISSMSVYQNILLPLKYQNKLKYKDDIEEIMEKLDISHLKNQKVDTLSGGEAQRVAVARSIVTRTPFILADEPTGALDPVNSLRLMELFKSVAKEYNRMIIVVTHNRTLLPHFDEVYEVIDGDVVRK